MYGNFAARAGVVNTNFRVERGDLYIQSDWNDASGKANIGNWFFISGIGTTRSISNSTGNNNGTSRTSIGNYAFFFAPSTVNSLNYIDGYFNLTQTVPLNRKLMIDSNYFFNDGFRTIEFMTGIANDQVFRIEHGGGLDTLFLRTGSTFSESANSNVYTKAIRTETYALTGLSNQQTGIFIGLKEVGLSNYFYQRTLPITKPIKQIHIYAGGVLTNFTTQPFFGFFVNNISVTNI